MLYRLCSICHKKVPVNAKCRCEIERDKKRTRIYDKTIRRSKDNVMYDRFYHSDAWINLRDAIRRKYNGLCVKCLIDYKKIKELEFIHHIKPIKECWEERLDEDNCIALCHDCHKEVHISLENDGTEANIKKMQELNEVYEQKYTPGEV